MNTKIDSRASGDKTSIHGHTHTSMWFHRSIKKNTAFTFIYNELQIDTMQNREINRLGSKEHNDDHISIVLVSE